MSLKYNEDSLNYDKYVKGEGFKIGSLDGAVGEFEFLLTNDNGRKFSSVFSIDRIKFFEIRLYKQVSYFSQGDNFKIHGGWDVCTKLKTKLSVLKKSLM